MFPKTLSRHIVQTTQARSRPPSLLNTEHGNRGGNKTTWGARGAGRGLVHSREVRLTARGGEFSVHVSGWCNAATSIMARPTSGRQGAIGWAALFHANCCGAQALRHAARRACAFRMVVTFGQFSFDRHSWRLRRDGRPTSAWEPSSPTSRARRRALTIFQS